ncbi:hypothetical protein H0H81_007883 [Sphagnurus paluster]|uniref:F-box domain-containing protein n=1 Tax=Sphagnurus paluster TaxID=117069 RepID=A0A9P7KLK1_9AGAR|nr:hypothetical protein H0H81_007883 [Sphagnurus paluster]
MTAEILQKVASEGLPPTRMNARRLFGSFSFSHQPPYSRLPNELLSEIFLYATCRGVDDRHEIISTPIAVSQVSTRWRNVAISTGALWGTIIITFPISRGQISRALTWLKRSRSYPLSIFLDFRDPSWDWDLPESAHPFRWQDMEALIRLLIVHAHRWKQFELLTDTWAPIFTILHYSRRIKCAPILESISLSRCNAFFAARNATFAPAEMKVPIALFGGLLLDCLREVSLTGVHVDWTTSPLRNLTTLEFKYLATDVTPTKDQFADILEACPNLHSLTIIGRGPQADSPPSSSGSTATNRPDSRSKKSARHVELMSLTSFTFGFNDMDYALEILSMFSFPSIKTLALENLSNVDPPALQSLDATPLLKRLSFLDVSSDATTTPFPLSHIISLKLYSISASQATFSQFFDKLRNLEYLGLYNASKDVLEALKPSSNVDFNSSILPCATLKDLECRDMDPETLLKMVKLREAVSHLGHVSFEFSNLCPTLRTNFLDAGIDVVVQTTAQ